MGIAAGDRAGGHGATRRAEGGGQPAGQAAAAQHVHPADGVAVRLVETSGAATDVEVRSGLRRVSAAARVDLLEQPRVQQLSLGGARAARIRDRHGADPAEPAAGAGGRSHACWHPTQRRRNRCMRGTGCTTVGPRRSAAYPRSPTCIRSRSPPSRIRKCSCGLRSPAIAATRCCTAGCGCCARTAGRPIPLSSRSCCRRVSTWRPMWW